MAENPVRTRLHPGARHMFCDSFRVARTRRRTAEVAQLVLVEVLKLSSVGKWSSANLAGENLVRPGVGGSDKHPSATSVEGKSQSVLRCWRYLSKPSSNFVEEYPVRRRMQPGAGHVVP